MKYILYLLKHKYYFFIEAIEMKLYWAAITHDLSKFLPSEFTGYYKRFFLNDPDMKAFDIAWCHHQNRNMHHWEYWVLGGYKAVPMPKKYVKEMVCDWRAFARSHAAALSAKEFYNINKRDMILHKETIKLIEDLINE